MNVNPKIANFTNHVVTECKLDSISIFISNKINATPELHYLYHVGVSAEAQQAYHNQRVFEHDPYSDMILREQPDFLHNESLILARDSKISNVADRYPEYWRFLHEHHVNVVGASSRRFLQGLYLVIGAHCAEGKHNTDEVPVTQLDQHLRQLLSMVSEQTLESILHQKTGYSAFQTLFSKNDHDETQPIRIDNLTKRETEIASLIYQGKQNKQIADVLGLSEYTVDNHLRRIYRKLGIHNRASLAAHASQSLS